MERYPRLQKVQRMLDLLNRALVEAETAGTSGLIVIRRVSPEPQVTVWNKYNDELVMNLAEELGLSGGETVGLFRWAESAGYISPNYGSRSRNNDTAQASLDHLESKGYEIIGELPDPGELLLLRLDAIQAAIEARQDLRPEEKEHATRALEELKHFLRGLPAGIVVEVASTFFRGMFGA